MRLRLPCDLHAALNRLGLTGNLATRMKQVLSPDALVARSERVMVAEVGDAMALPDVDQSAYFDADRTAQDAPDKNLLTIANPAG